MRSHYVLAAAVIVALAASFAEAGDLAVVVQGDPSAVARALARHGGRVRRQVGPRALSARISAARLAALQADPDVSVVSEDQIASHCAAQTPNDTNFTDGSLWGLHNTGQFGPNYSGSGNGLNDADIDAPEAWGFTTGDANQVVADIDTGIDYNHPDLAANTWTDPNNSLSHGFNYVNDTPDPLDDDDHGSHTAGTIGACGNNRDLGGTFDGGVTGVNWNVKIMALKFLDSSGSGYTSDATAALNLAVSKGVLLSNNSWGGGGYDSAMFAALTNAKAAGHIFVAAAGNAGQNNDRKANYPSNYNVDNVVSVAATTRTDGMSSFSNYGATSVELGAPGEGILSTTRGGTYQFFSGTSMATPHVTGTLALMRAFNSAHGVTQDYRSTINQLLAGVDPVASLAGKTITGGRLNALAAIVGVLPRVTASTPSGALSGAVASVRLTFNKAIDPASFDATDIAFTGPLGVITTGKPAVVAGSGDKQFDVAFESQTAPGDYAMTVGPSIFDVAGRGLDQNQNGVEGESVDAYTAAFTISSSTIVSATPNAPINDNKTTNSTLTVPGTNVLATDLNVTIDIAHTYDGDLVITLKSPLGTTVTLANRRGGAGDNFTGTTFDSEATTTITSGTAPFTGSYKPESALTTFNGKKAEGVWTLSVADKAAGDVGVLKSWSLTIRK